jgi:hypothetical protein
VRKVVQSPVDGFLLYLLEHEMVSRLRKKISLCLFAAMHLNVVNQIFDVTRVRVFHALLKTNFCLNERFSLCEANRTTDLFQKERMLHCEKMSAKGSIKELKNTVCDFKVD